MQQEIRYAIYLLGVGAGLVIYAHANFSTKENVKDMSAIQTRESDTVIKRLDRIEDKIDRLVESRRK